MDKNFIIIHLTVINYVNENLEWMKINAAKFRSNLNLQSDLNGIYTKKLQPFKFNDFFVRE